MLTPEQISAIRDLAGQITEPITNYLLRDIARRIVDAGQLTASASYQIELAQQLGLSRKEIEKELKRLLKVSEGELKTLLTQSAEVGYRFDLSNFGVEAVPFDQNRVLQQIVAASVELATDEFKNITQTLGMVDPYGQALPLQDAYRKSMDFALEKVAAGATDLNTAVRDATKNIAKYGVRTIDYKSGVHRSLEAAVRGCVMGGLGLLQEKISQQNHDDMGANGWEISAHAASAPDHEPIQGRQYSDQEYEALNNSLVRRIGTLNCGHAAFPIILGVNEPQYTEDQLEEFRRQNEKGITYQGKHYTMYEATQTQRKMERSMRDTKRRILLDEELKDDERLLYDQIRLRRIDEEYIRFSKAAELPLQSERAQAAGFAKKHGVAARNTAKRYENDFTFRENRGTIKAVSGATITNTDSKVATAHAERYYGLVRKMKTDVAHIAKNTGISEEIIQKIKNYIFLDEHDLGDGDLRRFDPSFAMAQSWQRLINGNPKPHDLTMLNHEMLEKELIDGGMTQFDAHIAASQKYNYTKESDEYYAALKKHKNRKGNNKS